MNRFEEMEKVIKELKAAASSSKDSRPGSVIDFLQQDRNAKKLKLSSSSLSDDFYPLQSKEILVAASNFDNDSIATDLLRTQRKQLLAPWIRILVCKHSEHSQKQIKKLIAAALTDSMHHAGPISGQLINASDIGSFKLTHISNSFSLCSLHFPNCFA
jgi:hypothetical protein